MPPRARAFILYRLLAAATGSLCVLVGILFVVAFLDRALFPVFARPLFATDYWGYYLLGFAGAVLFAWGGCLLSAARAPRHSAGIAVATAAGLIVAAIVRLLAWYSGEYRLAADQLRAEAAVLLVAALAFVWLHPPRPRRNVDEPAPHA